MSTMDQYEFRCGERVLQWGMARHEARLTYLRHRHLFPGWQSQPPWVGSGTSPKSLPRLIALADVRLSLDAYLAEEPPLHANYTYRLRGADGALFRPGNDYLARYDESTWLVVLSGPGVCCLVKSYGVVFTDDVIDDLVARGLMTPDSESLVRKWGGSGSYDELVHDLRDLAWFDLGDGRSIRAQRRAKPTCIVEQTRTLHDFLAAGDEPTLEARYIGTADSKAYAAHLASLKALAGR